MRFIYCLLLLFLMEECIGQHKKIGYSGYFGIGVNRPIIQESSPGDFSFINIGSETESNPGWEMGGVVYYRKIGFNLGFGYYKYEMDIAKYQTDMQIFYQDDSVNTYMTQKIRSIPLYTGLSYYFGLGNFGIEPRILVRLDKAIAPGLSDVYFWNNEELVRTINYAKQSSLRLDYLPAISLSYYYPVSRELNIGIQLTYQYSFSNPRFEYRKKDINTVSGTVTESTEILARNYSASNLSFGFIVRFN